MRISDWSSDVCSSDLVRDGVDYLVVDVPSELEAAGDLRVLEVVTEAHDRRDLAGDVTVLAPSADLVVAHLRDAGREGGGLGVLVDLPLEAVGRGLATVSPAVGRSEERRVGTERARTRCCRGRTCHTKQKQQYEQT